MALKTIKGISVEIGGSTTDLGTALKDVQSESSSVSKELTEVNKLLKFDPTDTELIAQKQTLLAEAVETSEEKLTILQKAQEDFVDSGKDIDGEEYRALQREIAATESNIEYLEKQQDSLKTSFNASMDAMGGKVEAVGDKVTEFGTKVSAASAVAAAALTASVAAFVEVDEGYDVIITKTGATGDAAQELEDIYTNLASTTDFAFEDIGAAIGEVNTRFAFTGEVLEEASDDFLKFAEINELDVSESISLVSRAMEDAGIEASEYESVLDALTVAGQSSGISVDTLAEYLTTYGAQMRVLGFETEESIALFAGWEAAGVNTETAFSGMKTAISSWSAEGLDAREEFSKTLEAIASAEDITEATTLAIDAFGSKAGPDLADAIQSGKFEIEDYISILEEAEGATDATFEATQDGMDSFGTATNATKVAAAELGEVVLEMLAPIMLEIAAIVSSLAENFRNMSEEEQQNIVKVLAVVAAVGPLLVIIGTLISTIGSAIQVFSALNAVIAANPVAFAIIAFELIVVAIIYLWKNCEAFRTFWISLWEGLVAAASAAKTSITTAIENMKSKVDDFVTDFKSAVTWISSLPSQAVTWGSDMITGFISGITSKISSLISSVSDVASTISSYLHFSCPDIGPLSTYEEWMPDFMEGMAAGIEQNKSKVTTALAGLSNDMAISVGNTASTSGGTTAGSTSYTYGGNSFNVYGAEGQSAKAIAKEVMSMINIELKRKTAVA